MKQIAMIIRKSHRRHNYKFLNFAPHFDSTSLMFYDSENTDWFKKNYKLIRGDN